MFEALTGMQKKKNISIVFCEVRMCISGVWIIKRDSG